MGVQIATAPAQPLTNDVIDVLKLGKRWHGAGWRRRVAYIWS